VVVKDEVVVIVVSCVSEGMEVLGGSADCGVQATNSIKNARKKRQNFKFLLYFLRWDLKTGRGFASE